MNGTQLTPSTWILNFIFLQEIMPTIVGRCGIYRLKNNQNKFGILTTIGWLVGYWENTQLSTWESIASFHVGLGILQFCCFLNTMFSWLVKKYVYIYFWVLWLNSMAILGLESLGVFPLCIWSSKILVG